MPKSKNAIRRIFILDELIRGSTVASLAPKMLSIEADNGPYTLSELTQKLNEILRQEWVNSTAFEAVSERTVKEDIKTMRENFGVQIDCRVLYQNGLRLPGTYCYPNRYCSIFHQGLSDAEAADAKNMLRSLRRFISLDQFTFLTQGERGTNAYNSIVKLFYNQKSKGERAEFNQEVSKLDVANVLFDSAIQLYHGTEFIDDLAEAIADQQMVRLTLKDGIKKADLNKFEFCPYVLKQYNNRWYCFGYSPHENWKSYHELAPASSIKLHDLHSIEFMQESDLEKLRESNPQLKSFYPITQIHDWDSEVFGKIFGVSIDLGLWNNGKIKPPGEVVVAYGPQQTEYEISKPLHDSAKRLEDVTIHDETWSVFRYKLHVTYEFKQQILMRSPHAKILAPDDLAEDISKRLKDSFKLYQLKSLTSGDTLRE